jgi:ADP-heptose:LPS heptosyltransferase
LNFQLILVSNELKSSKRNTLKTKQQLIIDKYIAKPIAFLLNFLVRIVGKMLSIDHSLDRDFKRIVICKFKGLGSIIQSTPMIAALREKYPNAEIIFVSTQANEAFLKRIDLIDTILTLQDKNAFALIGSLFKTWFRLVRMRPDVYIDLEIYSNFSTLVTLFSLSKNRIGFYLRSSSFRMGIYTHMMFFNSKVPISEVYLQIARLFGPLKSNPGLFPMDKNIQLNSGFIPKNNYIVINPNASDLRIERRWGKENFRTLIQQIQQKYPDLELILIGSGGERPYVSEVLEGINSPKIRNLAGKTSIDELIGIIKHAYLVITNDTGPMHIAFSCKSSTICLFGPCSPEQYGWIENTKVIYKKVYCSPCVHDFSTPPCKGNNTCMQLIEVSEVMQTVNSFLNDEIPLSSADLFQERTHYFVSNEALGLVNRSSVK